MATDPIDDILNKAKSLSKEQQVRLIEELSKGIAMQNGSTDDRTLHDVLSERGFVASITDAPPDLATNPEYLKGFGADGH